MKFLFAAKSGNTKTGKMPVVTSDNSTCPDNCSFKKAGCYAKYGLIAIHWHKLNSGKTGMRWAKLIENIKAIGKGLLWRYAQAGDLPGINNKIDINKLRELVRANTGKRGFTYTHKPLTKENSEIIKWANNNGFTINISCDNMAQADSVFNADYPVCLVVNSDYKGKTGRTPKGNLLVVCPAQLNTMTCLQCGICQKANRKFIVAFKAHGTCKNKVNQIVQ